MTKALLFALAAPAAASNIVLEDFKSPAHTWTQSNDPVMGGQSTGSFVIANGVGVFDGEVVDVPSLSAPGFIKVESDRRTKVPFADVSSCDSFYLKVKSDTEYEGFRLSVDNVKVANGFFLYGHKAPKFGAELELGATQTVTFPFASFSNAWDAATGDITESCESNAKLCLNEAILKDIQTIALWGEGVGGLVHLEVEEIGASGCGAEVVVATTAAAVEDIVLEDFSSPRHAWTQQNDPVMGGQSTGTFEIADGVGIFDGEVVDVPSLSAPGFITMESDKRTKVPYPDVSNCEAFFLTAKSDTDYAGYRFSVGNVKAPNGQFFTRGHKAPAFGADLEAGVTTTITFPFGDFSNFWSASTGEIIESCADNSAYCLTKEILADIKTISIWGEGVGGLVHLEIEKIGATGCVAPAKAATKSALRGAALDTPWAAIA